MNRVAKPLSRRAVVRLPALVALFPLLPRATSLPVPVYASLASATAAVIPTGVDGIRLQSRFAAGSRAAVGGGGYTRAPKSFIERFRDPPLPETAWFRSADGGYWINADPVLTPEQFTTPVGDEHDWAPAFTAMWTTATLLDRMAEALPGRSYRLLTTVDVEPHPETGGTAPLDLRGAVIKLGKDRPSIGDEYAGIRFRGVHSGRPRNISRGLLKNGTIDANNIGIDPDLSLTTKPDFSNGVIGVMTENASNVIVDGLHGRNYLQGYHVLFFRYTDGGLGGDGNCFLNSRVVGRDGRTNVRGTWNTKWYAHSSTCDLTVGLPGDVIAPGDSLVLSTPRTTPFGAGLNGATPVYWINKTASPVTVPPAMSESAYRAAGLTRGEPSSLTDEYRASGGSRIGRPVVRGRNNEARNLLVEGGYYGVTSIGAEEHYLDGLVLKRNVRGLAGEWSSINGRVGVVEVVDNKSSAFLLGYGCTGWRGQKLVREEGENPNAWIGEALFNIQLSSGNLRWERIETRTPPEVATGQYHIHIGPDCSDVYIGPSILRGDCAKAWVAVESAWNTATARRHVELYSSGDGWTAKPMHDIQFDGITIEVGTAEAVTATAFAILQVNDAVHGEARLSGVRLTGCRAISPKHAQAVKILESSASTSISRPGGVVIENSAFDPALL